MYRLCRGIYSEAHNSLLSSSNVIQYTNESNKAPGMTSVSQMKLNYYYYIRGLKQFLVA